MALLPWVSRSWDPWDYPSRFFDPFFEPRSYDSAFLSPMLYHGLLQPNSSYLSEVMNDPDQFKVMLNVSHFKPEEIEVKTNTADNSVVIHAKHEEKSDEHGFVNREFTRRYVLPEGTEADNVKSSLSPNGILTIEAPKKAVESTLSNNERIVPITVEKPSFGRRLKKWFGFGKL